MSRNILVPDAAHPSQEAESADAEQEAPEALNSPESAKAEAPESNVPDKYKGKSLEDIIAMHQNAEREIGRQANEVGTYRELVASLTEAKRADDLSQADTTDKSVEVTSDQLFDDPTKAIRSVVESVVNDALAPVRASQSKNELAGEVQRLISEHPDAEQIGAMPEFQQFVERSEYRMNDAQRWVEKQDVEAARRLLVDFKDYQAIGKGRQRDAERVEDTDPAIERARKVATESGRSSSGASGKKTLSKREVARVFMQNRELYDSAEYQRSLIEHARNGTLVD